MTGTVSNLRSVLVIVGPTGVGKTKLGVAIAKVLMTEVVSVDSLQVYSAGGIMTAKATAEEMNGIKHHLIDYLPADEEPDDFFRLASATIDDLHRRNCIPVLVGGSTSLTIPLLFDKFKPRYRILVFTLWSAESTLCSRLDDRVDEMIYNGLLSELKDIYKLEKKLLRTEVFSRGIWKAIGYREFHPYLASNGENNILLSDGISQMKESTKLYAKAQISWLKFKLIPLLKDQQIPQHSFEVTTSGRWQADVEKPAIRICTDWILAKPKKSIYVDRVAISAGRQQSGNYESSSSASSSTLSSAFCHLPGVYSEDETDSSSSSSDLHWIDNLSKPTSRVVLCLLTYLFPFRKPKF